MSPSITNTSDNPTPRSPQFIYRAESAGNVVGIGIIKVTEKLGFRFDYQQIVGAVKGCAVGVQAAVQTIKFAILAECFCINSGRCRVA